MVTAVWDKVEVIGATSKAALMGAQVGLSTPSISGGQAISQGNFTANVAAGRSTDQGHSR